MTDASRLAVLLGTRIRLVCLLLAPCAVGASVISVRHLIYEQDHLASRYRFQSQGKAHGDHQQSGDNVGMMLIASGQGGRSGPDEQ